MFLAGDPARIALIARHFQDPREVLSVRGFTIHSGLLDGVLTTAASSGIGCPSTALILEELIFLGARTFLRVGTCGSLQPHIRPGHLVISTAAVRDEGTSRQYVPTEYPAVAHPDWVPCLLASASESGLPYHVGITHSKDAFYSELPDLTANPVATRERWASWQRANVLATEMEASALFVLASMRACRAACLLSVVGSTLEEELISRPSSSHGAVDVAVEAMKKIIAGDKERKRDA